jgi:HTH-type transcriptional regulator / antitoxin MqsA
MASRIHPQTGEQLNRDTRPMSVRVGPFTEEVMVAGWYPEGAGDAIHTGADLAAYEAARKRLAMQYAAHLRASRKRWRLTQEQAGKLIGGGKRAFQKYETGKALPTEAAVGLIELLNADAENLERLRRIRAT